MRQQHYVSVPLGKLVVAIALVFGGTMYSDNAVSGNRDDVCSDLAHIAVRVHQYYRLPKALGGGGRSFVGLSADAVGAAKVIPWPGGRNAHGSYLIQAAGTVNQVVIEGVGKDTVAYGGYVTMCIIVRDLGRPDSLYQVY
jgi:hypothetical protein